MSQANDGQLSEGKKRELRRVRLGEIIESLTQLATVKRDTDRSIAPLVAEVQREGLYRLHESGSFDGFTKAVGLSRSYARLLARIWNDTSMRAVFESGNLATDVAKSILPFQKPYLNKAQDTAGWGSLIQFAVDNDRKALRAECDKRRKALQKAGHMTVRKESPTPDNADIPEGLPELASAVETILRLGDAKMVKLVRKYLLSKAHALVQ